MIEALFVCCLHISPTYRENYPFIKYYFLNVVKSKKALLVRYESNFGKRYKQKKLQYTTLM